MRHVYGGGGGGLDCPNYKMFITHVIKLRLLLIKINNFLERLCFFRSYFRIKDINFLSRV